MIALTILEFRRNTGVSDGIRGSQRMVAIKAVGAGTREENERKIHLDGRVLGHFLLLRHFTSCEREGVRVQCPYS